MDPKKIKWNEYYAETLIFTITILKILFYHSSMSDDGSGQNYRAIGVLQRLRGDQCCEAGAGVKKCWMIFSSIIQSSNIDWMLICKKIPKNKLNFLERKVEPVGHRCAVNIFFNGWKKAYF